MLILNKKLLLKLRLRSHLAVVRNFLLHSLKIFLKKIARKNLFMIEKILRNQKKVSKDHLRFISKKKKH